MLNTKRAVLAVFALALLLPPAFTQQAHADCKTICGPTECVDVCHDDNKTTLQNGNPIPVPPPPPDVTGVPVSSGTATSPPSSGH